MPKKRSVFYEIRKKLGVSHSTPVEVVPGKEEPKLCGSCGHYTTKNGDYIKYPSAYSKVGWRNMFYNRSTRHIRVGIEYLQHKIPDEELHELMKNIIINI